MEKPDDNVTIISAASQNPCTPKSIKILQAVSEIIEAYRTWNSLFYYLRGNFKKHTWIKIKGKTINNMQIIISCNLPVLQKFVDGIAASARAYIERLQNETNGSLESVNTSCSPNIQYQWNNCWEL